MGELRFVRESVARELRDKLFDPWVYESDVRLGQEDIVKTCLRELELCDIYVGVFWREFGQVTVDEFRYALALGKIRLVYVLDEHLTRDPQLEAFLRAEVFDLSRGLPFRYVSSATALAELVTKDVMYSIKRRFLELTASLQVAPIPATEANRIRAEVQRLQAVFKGPLVQGTAVDYLSAQLRLWFRTVGYAFERHEVRGHDFFEWIIDVPAWRGSNRILVQGVEGPAETPHSINLRLAVERERTDEGWLVTFRRVSPTVSRDFRKDTPQKLFAYSFDELLDRNADFKSYERWLQAEVERRDIPGKYVDLACVREEFDPATNERIATARFDADNGWIDRYIDQWLDDPAKGHISILGEFGTGKTWFCLHYAHRLLQRYLEAKASGTERPRLPLVIPLYEYARAVTIESLFSEFFFRKFEIRLPGYSAFEELNRMGKLLLIFDGFDEMGLRVDRQRMLENFSALSRVVVPGCKAILTSRTEYFPRTTEARDLLKNQPLQFEVLKLEKFDDAQVREVLSRYSGPDTVARIIANAELRELVRRPVMIRFIIEAMPELDRNKPMDLARVYLYAVRRIMERDIEEQHTFTSLADKLYFLCELSWEMLLRVPSILNYRDFPTRLERLFPGRIRSSKELDHWHFDMMKQALLVRSDDGDYFFAHRSLIDFFAAYKFVAELGCLAADFTDIARIQSNVDSSAPREYKWSAYFRRSIDDNGTTQRIAPLARFVLDDTAKVGVDAVDVERLSRGSLALAGAMVSLEPETLDSLCSMSWDGPKELAFRAQSLLPLLKYRAADTIARTLVEQSRGRPLRTGVAWVLGELGPPTEERVYSMAIEALEATVVSFAAGRNSSSAAWWESAFALEKIGHFGVSAERKAWKPLQYLRHHLPEKYLTMSTDEVFQDFADQVKSPDPVDSGLNRCTVVALVANESKLSCAQVYHEAKLYVDFASDPLGKRCYFVVWLCGQLQIRESVEDVLRATRHADGSVRNCAAEALGKLHIASSVVTKRLEELLEDSYYRTRFHAAESLRELASISSIPAIQNAIEAEEDATVKRELIRTLQSLDRGVGERPASA
jgi:hypothetical protein